MDVLEITRSMEWTEKDGIVGEITGLYPGLKGSVLIKGEENDVLVRIHHGKDHGTQTIGHQGVEEFADKFGYELEPEEFGETDDIYILKGANH